MGAIRAPIPTLCTQRSIECVAHPPSLKLRGGKQGDGYNVRFVTLVPNDVLKAREADNLVCCRTFADTIGPVGIFILV